VYEFYATCAKGAEKILAAELAALGLRKARPLSSGVSFRAALADAYRALLWLRTASRVLLVLDRVDATDTDSLYAGVKAIAWEQHIAPTGSLAVDAHGSNGKLRDSRFLAMRVKDAVCDRLRDVSGERPSVERERPDVRINVSLRGNKATIALDLAGEPLHRRGYRVQSASITAPLRETLAATMLLAAGWGARRTQNPSHRSHPMPEKSPAPAGGIASQLSGSASPHAVLQAPALSAAASEHASPSVFLDPLCGSGTLVIEAGLIAFDIAPGILRDYWGFTGWLGHDPATWDALLCEADLKAEAAAAAEDERFAQTGTPLLFASDSDAPAVKVARESARKAGLAGRIAFEVADVALLKLPPVPAGTRGLLAANPPYGIRLSTDNQLPALYAALASFVRTCPVQLALSLISPDDRIDAYLGTVPTQRIDTYNGPLETAIRVYAERPAASPLSGQASAEPRCPHSPTLQDDAAAKLPHEARSNSLPATLPAKTAPALAEQPTSQQAKLPLDAQQFVDRLRKMAAHRGKWARRAGVTCYRVYDADLPNYAVAIDLYQGAAKEQGARWLHIAEYVAPSQIEPELATQRLAAVLALAPQVLDVPTGNVFLKQRKQDKGGSQYAKSPDFSAAAVQKASTAHIVQENGLLFEVDLTSRLDTGLFLDHRDTRVLLRERAQGLDALNLFAYTGAASVYLAAGGARTVTTVDLSQTYLAWAQRNMERNGFTAAGRYSYERTDALKWVQDHRHSAEKYGLIFVDPPTFSNSAKMGKRSWDVQRDHAELLIAVSRLLAPGGVALFSTNLRSFKPDLETLIKARVELKDISAQTIPADFERNKKIHRCYLLSRNT
jgi:23S rRNA (guanine2445-N2)-methyltransferase / 23S rRNA (guanine2069-N7)-methyltransferase